MNDVQQRLAEVREENRLLYNTVQDLRGNIRVFCRIRPGGTTGDASQTVVDVSGDGERAPCQEGAAVPVSGWVDGVCVRWWWVGIYGA